MFADFLYVSQFNVDRSYWSLKIRAVLCCGSWASFIVGSSKTSAQYEDVICVTSLIHLGVIVLKTNYQVPSFSMCSADTTQLVSHDRC